MKNILIIFFIIMQMIGIGKIGNDIYEDGTEAISESQMLEAERNAFNARLLMYEGTQKGSVIKTLLDSIKDINEGDYKEREIIISFKDNSYKTTRELEGLKANIIGTKSYEVSFEYNSNDIIDTINIVEK